MMILYMLFTDTE